MQVVRALGLDPGIRGGLATVELANAATNIVMMPIGVATVVDSIEVPTIGTGAKERVNVAAVHAWLQEYKPNFAFIERAQAMPRQGASSGFKYGRAVGSLEATIVLCTIPLQIVEPTQWKRAFRLPGKDREAARQRALELFPGAHRWFARKKDHGLAEAALIALHGLKSNSLPLDLSHPRSALLPASVPGFCGHRAHDRGVTAVVPDEEVQTHE
jgi:crossover junction endodeoxyribonuclease RuvC